MSDNLQNTSPDPASGIRIERLNTDKTRKDTGSESTYHAYFELSGQPTSAWRAIFEAEWKKLSPAREASIDRSFLVVHCRLDEIAGTQLPALQKAVTATNEAYKQYAQKEATDLEHREDAWKQERKDVDTLSSSLRFE
jgi:hypothetical protein